MNDPWDVKFVRQSSQYISCMKINGVPLLPPLLSNECRKEMQYYKLLAKEVENRILLLKPYTSGSESDASEDKTDAPELPESEQNYELPKEEINPASNEKDVIADIEKSLNRSLTNSPKGNSLSSNTSGKITSNFTPVTDTPLYESSKLVLDLSLTFNQIDESTLNNNQSIPLQTSTELTELPEHDYEKPREQVREIRTSGRETEHVLNLNYKIKKPDVINDPFLNYDHDGPSSLGAKSFTGSLHDIHKESTKGSQTNPLIRQRSYTVLTPSPMLIAHLQIQSMSTGVEMTSISMSESLSNVSSPNKKRRSWDLETAKVKWSKMALELKKKNISSKFMNGENKINDPKKRIVSRAEMSKTQPKLPRSRSVVSEKLRRDNVTCKPLNKSEPLQKNKTNHNQSNENHNATPSHVAPKNHTSEPISQKLQLIYDCDDPAKRVRELYEKIQKQQLIQMATLVEKQKKEQMLLQQVFEEQNNLLYTQLKTICPKPPGDVKESCADKCQETVDRGPVSLSQLINHKPTESNVYDTPVFSTLTDTNNYINQCDSVLKKSRDITSSITKQQIKPKYENGAETTTTQYKADSGRISHSPNQRNTSRKLTYETSASSDRECDLLLTDRTNDTMADLNVTFPSDHSDDYRPVSHSANVSHLIGNETRAHELPVPTKETPSRSTDSAIRSMEDTLKNSILDVRARLVRKEVFRPPTAQERAAATKIVAYAKGYLVRRLMRTERVQGTVQTIRDALLCALQLHQEREGIRGADVDLHRRLIQQITAACYSLHDTFIGSSASERCALIAADRSRRRALALRPSPRPSPRQYRPTDIMSQSHTGSFPSRPKRNSPNSAMTQSNYENFSGDKPGIRPRYMSSPRRRSVALTGTPAPPQPPYPAATASPGTPLAILSL